MKPQLINTETAAGLPGTIFAWKKQLQKQCCVNGKYLQIFLCHKDRRLQTKVFLGAQQVLMFSGFFPLIFNSRQKQSYCAFTQLCSLL